MKKETLVLLLGFILILIPQLGIPDDWKRVLTIGAGIMLLVLGYLLLRDRFYAGTDLGNGERGTDTFIETTGSLFDKKPTSRK